MNADQSAESARPNGSPAGPVTEGSTPPSPLALTGEAPGPAGDPDDDEAGLDEDISRVEAAFEKLGEMLRVDGDAWPLCEHGVPLHLCPDGPHPPAQSDGGDGA